MKTTFKEVAPKVFANGFETIPVVAGDKMPVHNGWPDIKLTKSVVSGWANNGSAMCGVGIRCGDGVYAVDIDVTNAAMSNLIRKEVITKFGDAPCRVGRAPKSLLVYAGDYGHPKINIFLFDTRGESHKIEILGKGQQFVAYGIHKDTKRPYTWDNELFDVDAWQLNEFNHATFLEWFKTDLQPLIESKGWTVKPFDNRERVTRDDADDFGLMVASQPLELTDVEIDAYLAAYPATETDYTSWTEMGMALAHQFSCGMLGLDKWVKWSALDPERFDEPAMRRKWTSFGGSSNPVTFSTIIFRLKEKGVIVSTSATWLEQIAKCEDKHSLEQLIQTKIARDKSIGTVDLAELEGAVKLRFAEFGITLRADPLRKLFKPKQLRAFPDIGGGELPLETMDNLRVVCDNNDVVIRYNMIKKDDEILIKDAQWSIDNSKNASITWLRSACHKVEMRTTNLKNFVTLLADANQYNPVVSWVTSREWDGVSRIDDLYGTIVENRDLCTKELKETVVRRWMIGAIAAAFSPMGAMVRGVLVFQGEQYTGKTRWIEALAPKELDLIKTGRSLVVHDKDSVKQILSSWISELGELDATFKKSDIAALKAFITSDLDELRRPYAAAESQYARRTVFAASVNDSKFLQDDTGNSRFMVIPIVSLNHGHTLDMQQVWAEIYEMWKAGEKHYLSAEEMKLLNGHNENFTATDPIFEMIASHLAWESFSETTCKWMQVSDVLRWIGKDNPSKFEAISAGKSIKRLNGGRYRKSNGKQLVAVPHLKNDSLLSEFDNLSQQGNRFDYPEDHIPF